MAEPGEAGVGHGDGAGGAGPRVEQRQLAEHLPGAEHAEQVLSAVRGGPGQLDLAFEHHVEPVTLVAFVEQPVSPAQRDFVNSGPQRLRAILIERLEQRRPAEHIF